MQVLGLLDSAMRQDVSSRGIWVMLLVVGRRESEARMCDARRLVEVGIPIPGGGY